MRQSNFIKILSIILIFVLLFSVISTSVVAEEPSSNVTEESNVSNNYSYGYTGETDEFINEMANNSITTYSCEPIPSSYDNSTSPYFPAIGDQREIGSCASFATTYYQFTFHANKLNNIVTTPSNTYCPNWSYNYINRGKHDNGSNFENNYNVLKTLGAAKYQDYINNNIVFDMTKNNSTNYQYWLTDEKAQINALKTRVSSCNAILISPDTDFTSEGAIDILKTKIASGNILTVSSSCGWNEQPVIRCDNVYDDGIFIGYEYHGQKIIPANILGEENGKHAIAIVGYDDEICFDANNNGTIETGEKGAFKIVNSWGESWGNDGFMWVLYDAFNINDNAHIDSQGKSRTSFVLSTSYTDENDEEHNSFFFYYISVGNYDCNAIGKFDFETNNKYSIKISAARPLTKNSFDFYSIGSAKLPYKGSLFLDLKHDYTFENKIWRFHISGEKVGTSNYAIKYAKMGLIDSNSNALTTTKSFEEVEEAVGYEFEFNVLNLNTGDLNYDDIVSERDVTILNNYLDGNIDISSLQKKLADLNEDGDVNPVDCLLLSNKILEETITKNNGVYEISLANSDIKVGLESEFNVPLSTSSEFNHIQAGFIFENVKDDYFCIRSMHDPSTRLTNKAEFPEDGVVYKLSKKQYNENTKGVFNDADLFKLVKCVDNSYKIVSKYNGKYLTLSEDGELIFKNITENALQSFSVIDSPIKIGDVNMDYSITDADATLLQSRLDNEINLTLTQLYLGNVVFDDELDIKDVYGIKALTNEYYFDYAGLTYLCSTYDTVQVCNYSFSETQTEYKGNVVIPSYATDGIMTFKVVKIGNEAFKDCTKLTSITDEGEITDISYSAFENCSSLKTVNFKKVKIVNESAFENCSMLSDVSLGGLVSEVKDSAFKNCEKLSYIYFGTAPKLVGNNVFENCESLSTVYMPYVKHIGNEAFKGCSSLNRMVLLEANSIGNNAFDGCNLLKEIALPTTLSNIGTEAFANTDSLTIFGKKDSLAESFAMQSGIDFDEVLYDWETANFHDGSNYKISGLTSDTMVWRGTFEGSYDNIGLSNISHKSLKITNTMNVSKSLRTAISLPKNWLNEENFMKVWVGNFSGTVTFEFRGNDSMSYKKWIGTSKNGWINIPLSGSFYKNGPDSWEHTTVSKETISQAHTLWITFENMESGSSAYIDEIILSKN